MMRSTPLWLSLLALLLLTGGCTSAPSATRDSLEQRIQPPPEAPLEPSRPAVVQADAPGCGNPATEGDLTAADASPQVIPASAVENAPNSVTPPEYPLNRPPMPGPDNVSEQPGERDRTQVGAITLQDAINLAFRMQPRLRVFLASIGEAQGRADVAFAPFLPTLSAGISGGGFDLDVTGQAAAFSFLPPGAVVPTGLELGSAYSFAEVHMQWLICDFGRRCGRYHQAELGVEIARLQTDRAYQTVANEVAVAYYQVLRANSLRRIAQEAVRRADDDLGVARKLEKGGVIEKEKTLRVEVQLADSQRQLVKAEGAMEIALAALNLAMGVNVTSPTQIVEIGPIPPAPNSLGECLQAAARQRGELDVARSEVQVAQEGSCVARADFLPKIVAEGDYFNFEQGSPRANLNLGFGFIKLEWSLFEGGQRVGELRVADSKTRAAIALADSVADTISYQTVEAYRQMLTALKGIDLAKPAVVQARENYRLVKLRAAQGDATSTEITDAETALTRAEQDHQNAIYDYLTELARLEYAIGQSRG
jgi:outer membrane protein